LSTLRPPPRKLESLVSSTTFSFTSLFFHEPPPRRPSSLTTLLLDDPPPRRPSFSATFLDSRPSSTLYIFRPSIILVPPICCKDVKSLLSTIKAPVPFQKNPHKMSRFIRIWTQEQLDLVDSINKDYLLTLDHVTNQFNFHYNFGKMTKRVSSSAFTAPSSLEHPQASVSTPKTALSQVRALGLELLYEHSLVGDLSFSTQSIMSCPCLRWPVEHPPELLNRGDPRSNKPPVSDVHSRG
jgi:hypothetical protein